MDYKYLFVLCAAEQFHFRPTEAPSRDALWRQYFIYIVRGETGQFGSNGCPLAIVLFLVRFCNAAVFTQLYINIDADDRCVRAVRIMRKIATTVSVPFVTAVFSLFTRSSVGLSLLFKISSDKIRNRIISSNIRIYKNCYCYH